MDVVLVVFKDVLVFVLLFKWLKYGYFVFLNVWLRFLICIFVKNIGGGSLVKGKDWEDKLFFFIC